MVRPFLICRDAGGPAGKVGEDLGRIGSGESGKGSKERPAAAARYSNSRRGAPRAKWRAEIPIRHTFWGMPLTAR